MMLRNFEKDTINMLRLDEDVNWYEISKLRKLNEEEKKNLNKEIFFKIYKLITEKYNARDFKDIDVTIGDISRLENYNTLVGCIEMLEDLDSKSVNKVPLIKELRNCLENLLRRTQVFSMAYKTNNEMIKMIYETSVYSLILSTTAILITYVEVLKLPNNNFDMQLKTNISTGINNKIFIDNMVRFNTLCNNGEMDSGLSKLLKETKSGFFSDIVTSYGFIIAVFTFFAMSIRYVIYLVYKMREDLATWFDCQKMYLEMRIAQLQINGFDPKVIRRQQVIADNLGKWANKLRVEIEVDEKNVKQETRKEDQQISSDSLLI